MLSGTLETSFSVCLSTPTERGFKNTNGEWTPTYSKSRINEPQRHCWPTPKSNAGKARWSVTQNDKNGQALVQYRRMQQSDFHFGRKRLTYIKHWQCTSEQFTSAGIRASRGIFRADKYGQWIKSLEFSEIISFFAAKKVVAQKEISIELAQTESTADTWKALKPNPTTLKWRAAGTQPSEYVSDLLVE